MNFLRLPCSSLVALAFIAVSSDAATFRVATYNLENYLDRPTESRRFTKSEEARAKIRESILAARPDVIALQEMGTVSALLELRDSLKVAGLDLPHWEHVKGFDTNIFVAVLSRFPITSRRPHTNETFLLGGRRFKTSRGFVEVDIQVTRDYAFTLFSAHLKSQRTIPDADESEMRLEEAKILRRLVDARIAARANANVIVLGDFNSTKDTPSTRAILGRGRTRLIDTRPAERNGDNAPSPNPDWDPRNVSWTHYYGVEDSYTRIDYILISPGMSPEWVKEETFIPTIPNWGLGSDHRPLVATFNTDRN